MRQAPGMAVHAAPVPLHCKLSIHSGLDSTPWAQVAEERLRGWLQWADSHEERTGGGGGRGTNAQVAGRQGTLMRRLEAWSAGCLETKEKNAVGSC